MINHIISTLGVDIILGVLWFLLIMTIISTWSGFWKQATEYNKHVADLDLDYVIYLIKKIKYRIIILIILSMSVVWMTGRSSYLTPKTELDRPEPAIIMSSDEPRKPMVLVEPKTSQQRNEEAKIKNREESEKAKEAFNKL